MRIKTSLVEFRNQKTDTRERMPQATGESMSGRGLAQGCQTRSHNQQSRGDEAED
jgi:hypothetical protein